MEMVCLWNSARESLAKVFDGKPRGFGCPFHRMFPFTRRLIRAYRYSISRFEYGNCFRKKKADATFEAQATLDKVVQRFKLRNVSCLLLSDGIDDLSES